MPSTTSPDMGYDDPTQYAYLSDTSVKAYTEMPGLAESDRYPIPAGHPKGRKWSQVIAIAALGLSAAFLLAFLTLQLVRANEPAAPTPGGVVTESVTTVVPKDPAAATDSSSSPAKKAVTVPAPPPATMTNPLHTATTTVTVPNPTSTTTVTIPNPTSTTTVTIPEPPPATMTNPLEPPATMTNPLEPPATMTNPLEPPVGETHTQAE